KARDLFLRTHRPFRQIRVDLCKEADLAGRFIDEEQVYNLITAGSLDADNRLFFIVGEAGAGKSELCQWLEYRAEPARRLAIHIPRSMTSAAHVAALLRRALGLAGAPLLRRTPVATQARHVALSAAVLLYEQGDPSLAPTSAWEALLDSTATRAAIAEHLTAAARGESGHQLLPAPEAIGPQPGLSAEALTASWPALRRLVAQALEQALWLGDLRDTLAQIARAAVASGVRPLLLLEDVTAFRVLGDRLLDYLLDLTSGHFDAVIGVTTGFERTQLAGATLAGDLTHVHHRLRARLVLTDDLGRAYGLDDEVVDLARGYLGAIRGDLADPALAACDDAFGPGLYPFTETALRRAFAALHEEGSPRQTPRLFLEHVLGAALLSPSRRLPPWIARPTCSRRQHSSSLMTRLTPPCADCSAGMAMSATTRSPSTGASPSCGACRCRPI
ncbi:MAG: ATP-binding protein, partial [Chloroflexales bacterium]